VALETALGHGGPVAGLAGGRARPAAACDVRDPLVPEPGEVLHRQPGAEPVVGHDPVDPAVAHLAAEHDQRRAVGGGDDLGGGDPR
jgi:hypothetical protein